MEGLEHIKMEQEEHKLCYEEIEYKKSMSSSENSSCVADYDGEDGKEPDIKVDDEIEVIKYTSNIEKQNTDPAVKMDLEHELSFKWLEVEKSEVVKDEANMDCTWDIEGFDTKYGEQKTVHLNDSWDEISCDSGQREYNVPEHIKCTSNIKKEKTDPEDVTIDMEKCTHDGTTSGENLKPVDDTCEDNHSSVRWYHCKYYCGYKTRYEDAVKKHLQNKHKEGPQWYHCRHCEFKTINRYSLKRHELKHNDSTQWYKCLHCEFKSKDRYYFTGHLKSKHDGNTDWYKCKYCVYKTKSRNHLKSHFKYNHDDTVEWYHCHLCEYKTKYKPHLKNHFKNKHNQNVEWYHCQHCQFKAKSKNNLVRHLKHKHDSVEWYQCQYCEYRIKYKYDLKKHFLNKHNQDIEWLQCRHCPFKTKHKKSFKLHFKNKHGDAFEWYQCRFCEFKTKWRSYLREHFKRKHEIEENNKLMASSV